MNSYPGYPPSNTPNYGFVVNQQGYPGQPGQYSYPTPYPSGPSYPPNPYTSNAPLPYSLTPPSTYPPAQLPQAYPSTPAYPSPNLTTSSYPNSYVAPQPAGYPPYVSQPNVVGGCTTNNYLPGAPPLEPPLQQTFYPQTSVPNTGLYPPLSSSSYQSSHPNNNQYSFQTPTLEQIPTVYPVNPFDPRKDAELLHRAMKGFGTDEQSLINVLCRRTSGQRSQIAQMYKATYGKDLRSRLKSELSFNFLRVMTALTWNHEEFLACELRDAIKGLGTKERTLIEILCSSSNQEIAAIKTAYRQIFDRNLEVDIKGDTSGDFCRILVALTQGQRDESQAVNTEMAKQDAQLLYAAGEGRVGTEESAFIRVFASRSWNQLKLISAEYQNLRGRSLEAAIKREFSGWIETTLQDILQCAMDRNAYFASRIKESVVGAGTRDHDLIRLIVSRCDRDLSSINKEYQKRYGRNLSTVIRDETSGDYKRALLALIG